MKSLLVAACPQPAPCPSGKTNAACVNASSCDPFSRTAAWRSIADMNASATLSSTNTCFSPIQSRLLSYAAPCTTQRAARSMSAVVSTSTGGLPGPAQIARLPVCIAAATTPGPPVTHNRRTFSLAHISLNESNVGCSMMQAMFSMPVARWIASLNLRTDIAAQRAAAGCALNTTALPAATMLTILPARVGIECVDGVTAPTTPNGVYSSSVIPWSPLRPSGLSHSTPGTSRMMCSFSIL